MMPQATGKFKRQLTISPMGIKRTLENIVEIQIEIPPKTREARWPSQKSTAKKKRGRNS
jgi:hypothetical protein